MVLWLYKLLGGRVNYSITEELLDYISQHEGSREHAYDDVTGKEVKAPFGKLTIGIGFNIQDMGIPDEVSRYWLEYNIRTFCVPVVKGVFTKFMDFSTHRQYALIDMVYNLGATRFCEFKDMINSICANNWSLASIQALDSTWARQTGDRAKRDAEGLLKG